MADDELDVIGVLRTHLDEIFSCIHNARLREETGDLHEALRQGKRAITPSWITRQLTQAEDQLTGYLSVTLDEDDTVSTK